MAGEGRNRMSKAPIAAALMGTSLLIRVLGMQRSIGIVWWISARFPAPPLAASTDSLAERQARVIAAVAERLPRRPTCLPRALVLAGLLRRRRRVAELCVGARVAGGFGAHAWVEVDGRPVHEEADPASRYGCLWRLPTIGR